METPYNSVSTTTLVVLWGGHIGMDALTFHSFQTQATMLGLHACHLAILSGKPSPLLWEGDFVLV